MKTLMLVLVLSVSAATAGELIKFNDTSSGSWNDMKALALQQHKLIFVDAYTDWCSWCKVMDKETFPDPGVAGLMNEKFVNVRYEMETGFGMQMAAKYRVSGFPTFLIFTPEGKLVYRIIGYLKPKEFLEQLTFALDPSKQDNLAGVSAELDPEFPGFYTASFGKKDTRVRPDSLTVNTFLASSKNLFAEAPYSVMFRFYPLLAPQYKQFVIDNFDTLKYLYGKSDLENIAAAYVRSKLALAIAQKSESQLAEVLRLSNKYFPSAAKESALNYRIQYFLGTKQWGKYADEVEKGMASHLIEENGANSYGWMVYEQCDEKPVIARAATWMGTVVRQYPKYMFVDTYAALLFKNGEMKKAREYAQKAIALGRKEKTDVRETEALLEKINAQLASTNPAQKKKKFNR